MRAAAILFLAAFCAPLAAGPLNPPGPALAVGGAESITPAAQIYVKEGPAYVAPNYAVHVVTPAEGQVYAAYLQQAFAPISDDGPLARETLLVQNDAADVWQPNRRAWEAYVLKGNNGQGRADAGLLDAFVRRPQQVVRFYGLPAVSVPVRLLRSDLLQETFSHGGWKAFFDQYPKTQGVLSFSSVVVNAGGTEALFVSRLDCGLKCGYRELIFLRKVNKVWTMIMQDNLP